MLKNFYCTNLFLIFFLISSNLFSQYFDIGYDQNFFNISDLNASKYRIIKTVVDFHPEKDVKRVFNNKGELIEELVYINGNLSSGIEYFKDLDFPFLQVPRDFVVQDIEVNHNMAQYFYKKVNSSLTKYIPEAQIALFKLRVYNYDNQEFYILNIGNGRRKLFFK
ncbi:MAG: hypothetical protein CMP49_05105 [Flavobacteriales bacterium]|jgi:hypothetical protein|nr:hypothetical protein [Flavobacteriales bacterium]|tara:strand:- start:2971 stop:3465 length:495 start_codon:yes stop_codon:yes gene_type:complete